MMLLLLIALFISLIGIMCIDCHERSKLNKIILQAAKERRERQINTVLGKGRG